MATAFLSVAGISFVMLVLGDVGRAMPLAVAKSSDNARLPIVQAGVVGLPMRPIRSRGRQQVDKGPVAVESAERVLQVITTALGGDIPDAAELVLSILSMEAIALFDSSTRAWIWRDDGSEFYEALTRNGVVDLSVAASSISYTNDPSKLETLRKLLSANFDSLETSSCVGERCPNRG